MSDLVCSTAITVQKQQHRKEVTEIGVSQLVNTLRLCYRSYFVGQDLDWHKQGGEVYREQAVQKFPASADQTWISCEYHTIQQLTLQGKVISKEASYCC